MSAPVNDDDVRDIINEWAAEGRNPRRLPAAATEEHLKVIPRAEAGRVGEPLTMAGLRELPEPEERWLVDGWLPEDCNNLWAGYPKTYKTLLLEELAVAMATQTPFLGRFSVPAPRRVGLILMEDAKHRTRRRLERIANGRGLTLWDLDGLFFWFRPPLRLASTADLDEVAEHIETNGLEYLHIDSWSYVATGNSNDADEVTPQLQNLSRLREHFPGLSVGLTHHARKSGQDKGGDRLTDHIRNSSAFGAWYDVGVVLSRSDESAPVKVRSEMRDLPAPDPFMFTVEDQYPPSAETSVYPTGWLRLQASDRSPGLVEREAEWRKMLGPVREFLENNPGCSKRQLRDGITGNNRDIELAFGWLEKAGDARYVEPEKRGKAGSCELIIDTVLDRASTVLKAHPGGTVLDRAGEGPIRPPHGQHTPTAESEREPEQHGGDDYEAEWEQMRAVNDG